MPYQDHFLTNYYAIVTFWAPLLLSLNRRRATSVRSPPGLLRYSRFFHVSTAGVALPSKASICCQRLITRTSVKIQTPGSLTQLKGQILLALPLHSYRARYFLLCDIAGARTEFFRFLYSLVWQQTLADSRFFLANFTSSFEFRIFVRVALY